MPALIIPEAARLLRLIICILAGLFLLNSCASEPKNTALIDDPDQHAQSTIPWNKPAKWENGANFPGGFGQTPGAPGTPGNY